MNFEQRKKEKVRNKVFDILARADGSGMDKTGFINEVMELFEQSLSDYKKELVKELTRGQVGITQDTSGKWRNYIFLDNLVSLLQKDKENKPVHLKRKILGSGERRR